MNNILLALKSGKGSLLESNVLEYLLQPLDQLRFQVVLLDDVAHHLKRGKYKVAVTAGAESVEEYFHELEKLESVYFMEKVKQNESMEFQYLSPYELKRNGLFTKSLLTDLAVVSWNSLKVYSPTKNANILDLTEPFYCPVLLAPPKVHALNHFVFCYDGSPVSLAAIKSFVGLFGSMVSGKEVSLLMTSPDGEEDMLKEKLLIEFMQSNFDNVGVQVVNDGLETDLNKMVNWLDNIFVVASSEVISKFPPELLDTIINKKLSPIFLNNH